MPLVDGKQIRDGSIAEGKLETAFTDAVIREDGSNPFTGDQSMGGNKLTSVASPTADTDAANKAYVDGVAEGLDVKLSVLASSITDLNSNASISGASAAYSNAAGASGRGQITATLAVSDVFTLDAINMSSSDDGDRVLIKDESGGLGADANGIYTMTISGTSLTLDRAEDFDEDAEVTAGAFTFIEEGGTLADTGWVLITDNPITIGGASGTGLTFSQFTGAGSITAGAGLDKSGTTLFTTEINRGVQVNAVSLEVDGSEVASTGLEQDATNSWQIRIAAAAAGNGLTGGAGSALSVVAANTSVSVSGSGVQAAVPVGSNKEMTASVTASDGDQATATTLVAAPAAGSYIEVSVNGVQYTLGDGVLTKECYFSNDGGTTARTLANISATDTLHWNGTVAGFELAATDQIDLNYVVA